MLLRDVLPKEFFAEHSESRAAKHLDVVVTKENSGHESPWPGREKYVSAWWMLENGYAVGWNENPSHGWSFPVVKVTV